MLWSLDIHKAFDSLSWDYLFYVLKLYDFGPRFLLILRILYDSPTASILVKVYSSKPLNIHRGTRQECAISPLLFILAIEPIANTIWTCKDIQGIECGDREHKCYLITDDILLMLNSPTTSIPNLLAIIYPFSQISGLTINHSKSQTLNVLLDCHMVQSLWQTYVFQWLSHIWEFLLRLHNTLYIQKIILH